MTVTGRMGRRIAPTQLRTKQGEICEGQRPLTSQSSHPTDLLTQQRMFEYTCTKASAGVVEVVRAERQPERVGSSEPRALNQEILQVTDLEDFSFHRLATTTLEIEPFDP